MPGQLAGIVLVLGAYLAGAVPWGYLAGKLGLGVDLRSIGSGGTGATNVLRTLGAKASAIVLILDVLKGFLPPAAALWLGFAPQWVAAAAIATVIGHCWSPFIGFKGGKGVATGAGAAVALFPQVLVVLPMLLVVVWFTKYVSLGSLSAAGSALLLAMLSAATGSLDWPFAVAIVLMSAIIVVRHEGNIRRLLNGTERRFGQSVSVS